MRAAFSAAVVSVAWPLASSVALPRVVAPSWKVTVPVGVPTPALTVAVKVTACPYVEGLAPLLSAVEVTAGLTVWVKAALLLALSLASPP